jgi:glucose/mannose-6-phosphate isomerase
MVNLDDPKTYERADPQGMRERIAEMGSQLREARDLVAAMPDPGPLYRNAQNVLVLGMGGSAIGGDLVRTVVEDQAPVPILVSRDYRVPGFVGPSSLVIASSYSGNTEETISATREALDLGARVIAITTGGSIAELAGERGLPTLKYHYAAQPRAAVGFSFGLLLGLLAKLGYLNECRLGMQEAIEVASNNPASMGPEMAAKDNPAKQLALGIRGKLPVIYGAGILSEVARRWKGQFNENSKAWAYYEQLPELNHNAVVGYENPPDLASRLFVILLSCARYHPRVAARLRITGEILRQRGVAHQVVEARGEGLLAQMVDTIMAGDYASYYLAVLYGADPTPVKSIDFLKGELARL